MKMVSRGLIAGAAGVVGLRMGLAHATSGWFYPWIGVTLLSGLYLFWLTAIAPALLDADEDQDWASGDVYIKRVDRVDTRDQSLPPGVERFLWIGDGFDNGQDQVGRSVVIGGRRGQCIAGTQLTIDVKFD